MKSEAVNTQEKKGDDGIAQILDDIRDVISNSSPNTDVLELTEKVTSSTAEAKNELPPINKVEITQSAQEIQAPSTTTEPKSEIKVEDILSNLDLMPKPESSKPITSGEFKPFSEEPNLLSQTVIEQSKKALQEVLRQHDGGLHKSGIFLEDMVIEILKPQLAEWLNKNLPDIVTSIVQKEIKKIIP
jgi:cell pole-organizing protein PopZ